jgi:hypothetical protein
MANLRTAWSHAEERDNAIWQDDCVEVFLDPLSRGTATGMHIVVNSAGVCYDAWDGDRRLLDKNEWTGEMNLSPFDIDNNGYIELPPAIDPYSDNSSNQYATYDDDEWKNPYTKAWVLMHTITHEIGHALGGYKHSPFPDCLMHDYSYDWKRQDFMSDWYRARLMVHNKIREIPKEVFDE